MAGATTARTPATVAMLSAPLPALGPSGRVAPLGVVVVVLLLLPSLAVAGVLAVVLMVVWRMLTALGEGGGVWGRAAGGLARCCLSRLGGRAEYRDTQDCLGGTRHGYTCACTYSSTTRHSPQPPRSGPTPSAPPACEHTAHQIRQETSSTGKPRRRHIARDT